MRIARMPALIVLAGLVASGPAARAQAPSVIEAADLESVCRANARDEAQLQACLDIVATVLAPDGVLALPAGSTPSGSPAADDGVGGTQSTSTLRVTLLAVEWEAAIFPRDEVDVVAAELAFESTAPEAFIDPGGLAAIDEEGFVHTWGALHEMGEGVSAGYLPEGRRIRGWFGFEVPAGTHRLTFEYRDGSTGERLAWTVGR